MGKRKNKNFNKEFKIDAVKLITEQGYSIPEASSSLGVAESTLRRWKREILAENNEDIDSLSLTKLQIELRDLKKENKRLKMEREILKKAAAFFAKETE